MQLLFRSTQFRMDALLTTALEFCNHRLSLQGIKGTLNYDTYISCNHGLLFQGNKGITLSHIYRRRKRIIYNNNPTATFCLLLIGDLVFKLNPGPVGERIEAVVSIRKTSIHSLARPDASRNTGNLITVNCSAGISNRGRKVFTSDPLLCQRSFC